MVSSTLRMKVESSTTSTRIFLEGVAIFFLRHRRGRAWRLRSHKLFYSRNQLILLHGFRQESRSAFLHCAVAMLGACTGGHNHHRNAPRRGALPQLHHQLVTRHARHFEVGDDQVTAVLRDEFRGFEAVRSQLHAIAVLFQHTSHELSHADRVVGYHDDALLLDAIDRFGRDRAARYSRRTWSKNTSGAGICLERAVLGGFRGDHAIQVDEQNQAAVWRNRCAREKFDAAQIFPEVLDNDFVFAKDFLNHQTDLMVASIGHNHPEKSVHGLERRQAEKSIQANDFGYDVANFR